MCLYTVTNEYEKPTNKVVEVYKCFTLSRYKLSFRVQCGTAEVGKWIKARGPRLSTEYNNNSYPSGFHGHTSERACKAAWGSGAPYDRNSSGKAAHCLAILKVKFRKVVAKGKQDGICVVAKEMYIPKSEFNRAIKRYYES